jgi:hypothetical protein
MYNYYDAVKADVLDYIREEINLADYDCLEGLSEKLEEILWIDDSVTGNASGSYTFNSNVAKEYVFDNMDLVEEMASDFCVDLSDIGRHFLKEDWEWFDVSIRCYVLGACIADALEEIREEWEEIHNSDDDDDENE